MPPSVTPNGDKIIQAVLSADISPTAKELAWPLVVAWTEQFHTYDHRFKTRAVEVPWYYWIQPKTIIIGVMDRIAQDSIGLLGCEWKSAKEPQQNRDGSDSAWWNEEVWLEQIRTSPQLSIYALGMHKGIFCPGPTNREHLLVSNPRIMVRAAVKSNPPRFWPTDHADGVFEFPNAYLEGPVTNALIAKAEAIRAARKSGRYPWALIGLHCKNVFRKLCPFFEPICSVHQYPMDLPRTIFDDSDPGSKALAYAGINIKLTNDPELVILSASSFQSSQECLEKYHIITSGYVEKESAPEQEVGTGLHAGLAELYRQHKQSQSAGITAGQPKKKRVASKK